MANAQNFGYGISALTNSATITSSEAGTQTVSATVLINKSSVFGASSESTGLTNYFFKDSFLLPLLIILAGLWFYFSSSAEMHLDKLKSKIK